MTKLIIMSDSHGYSDRVNEIIRTNPDADYYLHCGDLCDDSQRFNRLILVKGNNDYESVPYERIIEFEGVRILMTHCHRYPYLNRIPMMADHAKEQGCRYVFYGHTHVPGDDTFDGIRLLNPGSLMYNRDYSEPSYLVMEINSQQDVKIYRKFV